jgi:DNA-binding response OmpR family regulator
MTKVLLIEDINKVWLALSVALKTKGYEIFRASDAVSAISQARKCSPDVILLDINLPGGDGFLVAKRLKGLSQKSSVPLIFIAPSKQEGLLERAMGIGAQDYLEKSLGTGDFLQAIETALEAVDENLFDMQIS